MPSTKEMAGVAKGPLFSILIWTVFGFTWIDLIVTREMVAMMEENLEGRFFEEIPESGTLDFPFLANCLNKLGKIGFCLALVFIVGSAWRNFIFLGMFFYATTGFITHYKALDQFFGPFVGLALFKKCGPVKDWKEFSWTAQVLEDDEIDNDLIFCHWAFGTMMPVKAIVADKFTFLIEKIYVVSIFRVLEIMVRALVFALVIILILLGLHKPCDLCNFWVKEVLSAKATIDGLRLTQLWLAWTSPAMDEDLDEETFARGDDKSCTAGHFDLDLTDYSAPRLTVRATAKFSRDPDYDPDLARKDQGRVTAPPQQHRGGDCEKIVGGEARLAVAEDKTPLTTPTANPSRDPDYDLDLARKGQEKVSAPPPEHGGGDYEKAVGGYPATAMAEEFARLAAIPANASRPRYPDVTLDLVHSCPEKVSATSPAHGGVDNEDSTGEEICSGKLNRRQVSVFTVQPQVKPGVLFPSMLQAGIPASFFVQVHLANFLLQATKACSHISKRPQIPWTLDLAGPISRIAKIEEFTEYLEEETAETADIVITTAPGADAEGKAESPEPGNCLLEHSPNSGEAPETETSLGNGIVSPISPPPALPKPEKKKKGKKWWRRICCCCLLLKKLKPKLPPESSQF